MSCQLTISRLWNWNYTIVRAHLGVIQLNDFLKSVRRGSAEFRSHE